jgi:phage terminase large subunit
VSCDVARYGSDETVIALREGQRIRIIEAYNGRDTVYTAGRLKALYEPLTRVVVDDSGVGGGVTDHLRAEGIPVDAFNGGQAALTLDPDTNQPAYPNRRSEAWFHFADLLPELDLDADDQLLGDLSAPRYKYDARLRRVVEAKEETRKRLGRSPDRADAVLMAFAPSLEAGEAWAAPRRRLDLSRVKGA